MSERLTRGFATSVDRKAKAEKILLVLEQAAGHEIQGLSVLDIGAGSGEIASCLGVRNEAYSVDISDQRCVVENYRFVVSGTRLPFPDETFDVVTSNHVIEHLPDQQLHLSEIARVLKGSGLCYLATPNRVWPIEVHSRVPLLHYLPSSLFHPILKRLGRFRERLFLIGYPRASSLLRAEFDPELWSDRVLRRPAVYALQVPNGLSHLLSMVPLWIYRLAAPLHPTFIWILRPKKRERSRRSVRER